MEIKYTLEIVTKDIQDIGKLVENLHKSPEGSTLELDLALSKLRNVYDILNVIRTDIIAPDFHLNQLKPPTPEPVVETKPEPVVETKPEPVVEKTPEPVVEVEEPSETKNAGTIAEKFSAESSINENMAGSREQEMESRLVGTPIDNIGKNIGINDRFLIIRELFDGDSDGFGKLIKELDEAENVQVAGEMLSIQFKSTPNHEGVIILSTLVKRRFIKS